MKRGDSKFLNLAKKLDDALDESTDIFFKNRPWLADNDLPHEFKPERTDEEIEEKITNEFTIEKLVKELSKM